MPRKTTKEEKTEEVKLKKATLKAMASPNSEAAKGDEAQEEKNDAKVDKAKLVMEVLAGSKSSDVARMYGVDGRSLAKWRKDFIRAGREALEGNRTPAQADAFISGIVKLVKKFDN